MSDNIKYRAIPFTSTGWVVDGPKGIVTLTMREAEAKAKAKEMNDADMVVPPLEWNLSLSALRQVHFPPLGVISGVA